MKVRSAALAVAALAACSSPPPPGVAVDVATVAGLWQADAITLSIAADGAVSYVNERSGRIAVSGAGKNFTSTGFDVDTFVMSPHFVINALPASKDGQTVFVVDGNALVRVDADSGAANGAFEDADDPGVPAPAPQALPPAGTVASYAGMWAGEGFRLRVLDDGTLFYKRSSGGSSTSLSGVSLSNVTAAGFDAGVLGVTTHFAVGAPPAIKDGHVEMTVDGVVLTRMQRR